MLPQFCSGPALGCSGLLRTSSGAAFGVAPGCSGLLQTALGCSGLLRTCSGLLRTCSGPALGCSGCSGCSGTDIIQAPGRTYLQVALAYSRAARGCSRLFPASSGLLQGRSMLLLGYSGLLCGALDRSTLFQLLSATPCYSRSPRVAPGFLQLSSRLLQANSRLLCFAPLVPGLLQVTPCCSSLPRGIPRCSRSHWVVPRLLHFALGLLHVTPRCWGAAPGRSRLLHVAPGCCTLLCATSI